MYVWIWTLLGPWEALAYNVNASGRQFMLGEHLLIAPVTTPLSCGSGPTQANPNLSNCSTGAATTSLWLPGATDQWLPAFNNSPPIPSTQAGVVHVASTLGQVPVYAKRGSVLPTLPYASAIKHGSASRAFDPLTWVIYGPEASGGAGNGIEDDGLTTDTASVTLAMHYFVAGNCINMTATATGQYFGAPSTRQYSLRVVKPELMCDTGQKFAAGTRWKTSVALTVFGTHGKALEQLPDCDSAIRTGTGESSQSGWCADDRSGDLFVLLPRVLASEPVSASFCGVC